MCTDLFAFISAVAVDSTGAPVNGLSVTDSVLRTGNVFAVQQQGYPSNTATVFSDSHLGAVREDGDSVVVKGAAAAGEFRATWVFGSDGCHVKKLAGPDTVVIR